tara:strand:+ start:30 stop:1163 length:1134 start_codon:yes stop_codon:yes gene_type:complete
MKIKFTGDFFIDEKVNNPKDLINDITPFFEDSDFNIVNLESPVSKNNKQNKILKTGPNLNGNPKTFEILKELKINLVTLANNHIMDYGEIGLLDTLKGLKKYKISNVGIGKNIKDAVKPFTIEKKDVKIAILNFAENEWSNASDEKSGANPLDIIENIKQINKAKLCHDKVIVIIHGGHEYYNLPSPRMVKQYRFFAENGADVIIGHHTHCISGYEVYKNVPIFYSLGNMLFTIPNKNIEWYTGIILELECEKDKMLKWKIHPIEQSQKDYRVSLLNGAQKERILNEVDKYSKIIKNEKEFMETWKLFIQSKKKTVNIFSPISSIKWRYLKGALNRLGFNKLLLKNAYLAQILNHIRCEAHKDVVSEILNDQIYKNK